MQDILDITIEAADPDHAVGTLKVGPQHLQPFGLVHGGVHCALVEGVGSMAAYTWLQSQPGATPQDAASGVSNHTEFLRPVHEGAVLRAEATPVHRGRTLQTWKVEITDEQGRLCAFGVLKLANYRVREREEPAG